MQFKFSRLCCLLGIWLVPSFTYAGALDQAVDQQVQTDIAAQRTQQQIDSLDDETRELLAEYRSVLNQKESLAAYNSQLEQLVSSQQDELASVEDQLANIDTTQRDITPLMIKMVEVIEQFVELDTPFLPEERNSRVAQLKTMMDRADVNLSEKYRRILEAYQVETEYGRTLEAYQGELVTEDRNRTVDFLRVGRVGLYYLTLDQLEAGMWDQETQSWQQLPRDSVQSVIQGMKVARKQLPPDLLTLPVKTPEANQ
jgi:chromosome segregation ATPase